MTGLSLPDFAGAWELSRVIEDIRAGQSLSATGRASLEQDGPASLIYREHVWLSLPGQKPIEGKRSYLWHALEDGNLQICFDDGRPFHRIALGTPDPSDTHHCDPDLYQGQYSFADWPNWRAIWRVRGPRKDYRMETTYQRTAGQAAE